MSVVKSGVAGLLSGSRGTYATEEIRQDDGAQRLLGLDVAPEEATFWRSLAGLGGMEVGAALEAGRRGWVRGALSRLRRSELEYEGFVPVFGDGSLLEGSEKREGTTYVKSKGWGLRWTTVFVGPFVAGHRLAGPREGEHASLRRLLPGVVREVLKPLRLVERALVLVDSLHGNGPTLDEVEGEGLLYVAGANKLQQTEATLVAQPEAVWADSGARPELGWSESGVCTCWLECAGWCGKRLLVGRRWKKDGEFVWNHAGVLTNVPEERVESLSRRVGGYAQAIWRLYDHKAGREDLYKDLLVDLDLHHPPCRELRRNRGFYALAVLAHTLARAVDALGGRSPQRGRTRRQDGALRQRPTPRRMRLWRLCRRLLTLPAVVTTHARTATVKLLGLSAPLRQEFSLYWLNVCRC
ncbi:MAG: hypothetical protein NTW86_16660 [Candidatus Sumerlaeota bacterium]|nr:hypothetical protein [Candidatus Sumerlaeota bacterium]